jgi:nucleotide-binding universal stress UspA family protein
LIQIKNPGSRQGQNESVYPRAQAAAIALHSGLCDMFPCKESAMAYKTILVHVDASERCRTRIDIALRLAREFEAHLVGLHVRQPIALPPYVSAEPVIGERLRQAVAADAVAAESTFTTATAAAGLAGAEFRAAAPDASVAVSLHARYADLVILGQRDPQAEPTVDSGFVENVLLAAGRPVLTVPYVGAIETLGKRVLVAWNASSEAARALTDAIPLLQRADEVQVLTINPEARAHGDIPGADIALYLARHGVRVEVKLERAADIDVGNMLLSRAADLGVDLLVMGAYGHSRVREYMMGGATRTLLKTMTVPVFMSH